jgi:hypothetical protein
MGTTTYGLCHECKNYVDLDKFYSFATCTSGGYADIDKETLDEFIQEHDTGWVYRSMRLQYFLKAHTDHRVGVHTEHDIEQFGWYDGDNNGGWVEQFPWPHKTYGEGVTDGVDFTDPKAERLVINTKHGDVYLDVRTDGVNCWSMSGGPRRDFLIIPAKQ